MCGGIACIDLSKEKIHRFKKLLSELNPSELDEVGEVMNINVSRKIREEVDKITNDLLLWDHGCYEIFEDEDGNNYFQYLSRDIFSDKIQSIRKEYKCDEL